MTPAEASRILGCVEGAPRTEVDRAYRLRARESHPDRFVGQSQERIDAAAADFARIGQAYAVLSTTSAVTLQPLAAQPYPRAVVIGWSAVLALGCYLSFTGDARLFGDIEFALRLAALAVGLVGYAFTGRRVFFVVSAIALAITIVSTLAAASFGSLLALFVLAPSALALLSAGRRAASAVARRSR